MDIGRAVMSRCTVSAYKAISLYWKLGTDGACEASAIHRTAWRRGSGVAACGARTTAGDAGRWLHEWPVSRRFGAHYVSVPTGLGWRRFYRRPNRQDRVPLGERRVRQVAG